VAARAAATLCRARQFLGENVSIKQQVANIYNLSQQHQSILLEQNLLHK
jgi:hypothetical protein